VSFVIVVWEGENGCSSILQVNLRSLDQNKIFFSSDSHHIDRWLSLKYPKIITDLLEKRNQVIGGEEIPLNLSEPNPNGVEYDNLYVDMNGLIHPCSHPEDREAPLTEADMYLNVTKYVDRLFAAVRPRRLLFLAIDGVAPRAKMNQQRARRFRAAQEATERAETMQEVLMEMEALGLQAPPSSGASWDSNVITPGTEFMDKLSVYIRFYILDRMNRSPAWKAIKVIFSDASEPGEGEHKIMKFIRAQRCQDGYDPNQRHILHGLDADLIMLGLATHEAHFTILREEVTFGGNKKDSVSEARKMLNAESAGISSLHPEDEWVYAKPLQCLHIDILREYLEYEFKSLRDTLPFHYDLERIIDDFVFICFFVGNDFLPHLPSLDIRDGAIDFLIEVYKEMLPSMGHYVTSPGGVVNLRQVDILLSRVGEVEDEVFQRRKAAEDRDAMRMKRSNDARGFNRNGQPPRSANSQIPFKPPAREPTYHQHLEIIHRQVEPPSFSNPEAGNADAASALRQRLGKAPAKREISEVMPPSDLDQPPAKLVKGEENGQLNLDSLDDDGDTGDIPTLEVIPKSSLPIEVMTGLASTQNDPSARKIILGDVVKKKLDSKQRELIEKNKLVIEDVVKLHEKGWKDRYYGDKFKKEDIEKNGGLSVMFKEYIKGLCWVLKYYYQVQDSLDLLRLLYLIFSYLLVRVALPGIGIILFTMPPLLQI
jgi:5'-3' exoribonuclease 2